MNGMAGDRGDVDDRSLAVMQGLGKTARQGQWGKEIQLEHLPPGSNIAIQATKSLLERRLRADGGIVHQGMDSLAIQNLQGLLDKDFGIISMGEINGDMMCPVRITLAILRHHIAAAGDDAPAFLAEALYRGMAYPAAGTVQDHRLLIGGLRHFVNSLLSVATVSSHLIFCINRRRGGVRETHTDPD